MSEPEHVSVGLEQARRALAEAKPAREHRPLPTIGEDFTPADAAAERVAMQAAHDEARWLHVCPRRFRDASWDWLRREHGDAIADELVAWSEDEDAPNLVLLGSVGVGKTASALLACKDGQLRRGQGLAFYPVAELLDELRPGGDDTALGRLVSAPRLILDDLGSERPTDWTAERLGIVVNRRWMEELATVATSNLEATALMAAIGERTYSRLVDGALVVQLVGVDRRRRRG